MKGSQWKTVGGSEALRGTIFEEMLAAENDKKFRSPTNCLRMLRIIIITGVLMRSRTTRRELFWMWACACARYPDHSSEVGKVGNVPLSWETKDMVVGGSRSMFFFSQQFIFGQKSEIEPFGQGRTVPIIFGNRLDPTSLWDYNGLESDFYYFIEIARCTYYPQPPIFNINHLAL